MRARTVPTNPSIQIGRAAIRRAIGRDGVRRAADFRR
jgi:hypothetical protein